MRCKKPVTHVESHASAVSLPEGGEQRYIKATDNNNNNNNTFTDPECRVLARLYSIETLAYFLTNVI